MATDGNLEALQGLHRDLLALSENRLIAIERLLLELEARLDEFRNLLDKKVKNDTSRQKLSKGTIELDSVQYTINEEFKQETIEIADELNLDELEAAKLFLTAQEDAKELDRSPIVAAVIRFHQRRQFLLECLRLAIKLANEELEVSVEDEDPKTRLRQDAQAGLRQFVRLVLNWETDTTTTGCKYWQKCLDAMVDMEAWLQRQAERSQRASVIGHSFSEDATQIIEYERTALVTQHESLASICTYLVKAEYTYLVDFRKLLDRVKTLERHDIVLVHYLPVLMSSIARAGNSEAFCTREETQDISNRFLADKEADQWALRNFNAAMLVCWYAECASRGIEIDPLPSSGEKDDMSDRRFGRFMKALQDSAFHFLLSVAQDVKRNEWPDPAKTAIIEFLLEDAVRLPSESPRPEEDFQALLMDQYQAFTEAFITNLPDTLRRLKLEEDEQRRLLRSRFQRAPAEYQSHLERFLVIISFAYDDDPDAGETFFQDPDGNLYGFLQWLAKRQTTPRVAAFCEMLRSLSQTEKNAKYAHEFLLEEGTPIPGKLRRTGSISWNQIFAELDFYANSIKERPVAVQSGSFAGGQVNVDQLVEPESALMLECYLRLVSHLCMNCSEARIWLLSSENPRFDVLLLQLASSNIESRLRACAFTALTSLLVNKTPEIGERIWVLLDLWISGGVAPSNIVPRAVPAHPTPTWSEQMIFEIIAVGHEEPNAFVRLLNALVSPYQGEEGLNDALPFPEHLGSSYRMPGISSYVDFAVGRIFGAKSLQLTDAIDQRIMCLNCLDFVATCLSTFNEDLVVMANRANFPVEEAMRSSSLEAYARLQPFARTMEWMYNEKALKALFTTAHQDINEVNAASPDSPFILSLIRSIDVMNLILKLQPTYLDIVRPLVKQSLTRKEPVSHAAIASFEDAVLVHLDIVVDLGLYCGTGHQDLISSSLALLEKLATSRKLAVAPTAGFGKRSDRSKLIGILERENEGDRIARSLIVVLQPDERELEGGPESPGYTIKVQILSFLLKCLQALPDRPTIAHLLLGFTCRQKDLEVALDGLFAQGQSLFHAIVRLSLDYPDLDGESFSTWLSTVKVATTNILRELWRTPISSALTMTELRSIEYVFLQALRQPILTPDTVFDGKAVGDPDFLKSDSAIALHNVLSQRIAFLDILAREIRVAHREGFSSLLSRLSSTLLGSTSFPGVDPLPNPTIFDFFDFMEINMGEEHQLPPFDLLKELDFSVCKDDGPDSLFNLAAANELILLQRNELQKQGRALPDYPEYTKFAEEAQAAILVLRAANQRQLLEVAFAETLKAWVQVITVGLENGDFDANTKADFSFQALQLILPKLEQALSDNIDVAVELAQLVCTLLRYADDRADNDKDPGSDRLFNVFRISLNGIISNIATLQLREICYLNCYRYLGRSTDESSKKDMSRGRKVLRAIKLAGSRLIDTICDDAYSDQTSSSRVAALFFLDALVSLSTAEKSEHILECFNRSNFVGVLVDSIKLIPQELTRASDTGTVGTSLNCYENRGCSSFNQKFSVDMPSFLSYYTALLTVLLRIARTRLGASQILHSGLFQAVRDSQLFSADPDVGFGRFSILFASRKWPRWLAPCRELS